MMAADPDTGAARDRVAGLVRRFRENEVGYLRATYNETQARTEFITPLLEAFGWDVHNAGNQPPGLREVIEEATVEVDEERRLTKKPDYELRLARQRKLFVEAKKPSVRIERDPGPAFQARRYGYSANLPIVVLTNFHHLAVYDCQSRPAEGDAAHVARRLLVPFDQFDARFDELWPLLSREAIYSGEFDRRFAAGAARHGAEQFDDFFLGQVRSWRERLAADIHANTPGLSQEELTYAVQLFLLRIVFLRICEDREIERYGMLQELAAANTFEALMAELRRADEFYNSGLFRMLDDRRLGVRISDDVLRDLLAELYYPRSPYTFAVVETEVLGQIYEQLLGEVIAVADGTVRIVSKPEVRASGGVVPTPRYIVDAIVARTLAPALAGKSPAELVAFTAADICCGSGVFLLSIYEGFLDHYLSWYLANDRPAHKGRTICEAAGDRWRLTFEEKRRILLAHVRGVDLDPNAVEVARFSLLLKLMEDETASDLREYVAAYRSPALPSLESVVRFGNSLVSPAEWEATLGAMPDALIEHVKPFSWPAEFPAEMGRGGFDVIVANPPYIRIQHMTEYSPDEVAFYQSSGSPYSTAGQDNFDKYALFIERALALLRPDGRLGVITPHKFMTTRAGRALRRLISSGQLLEQVVHFGAKRVFGPHVANYTCILVLDRRGRNVVRVERIESLEAWRYGAPGSVEQIPANALGEDPWGFGDRDARALFARVRGGFSERLGQLAEIFVGVQTSADGVYIFPAGAETAGAVTLRWNGRDWPIERGVLRPCLHDARLYAYARPQPNAWMIFPYELVADRQRTEARLIQPDEMARRFPGCLAYLEARRAELGRRNVTGGPAGGRQFYQFGRSQSLTKFDSPKIILPILSIEPRYAYDDANIVVTGGGNGPYYMLRPRSDVGVTNHYLLAILNHPLSEAFVRSNTSTFRGGYYSHGKQFIEDLPVPVPTDVQRTAIEALVGRLIDVLGAGVAARTPHQRELRERQAAELRAQIERSVTALFGLSAADMDVARSVPIPA